MKTVTQERLKELFDYEDGQLIRKKSIQSRSMAGSVAGGKSDFGRFIISIDYRRYKLHRMIWLWHFGSLPSEIDHIDCNPSNNKIENLRAATHAQNMRNVRKASSNKSGFKGVRLHSQNKKWTAQISINNKSVYLGSCDTPEAAHALYCEAAKTMHKEFARLA